MSSGNVGRFHVVGAGRHGLTMKIADGYEPASGDAFRSLRQKHGWTQRRTAQALFTTQKTVSQWENGTPIHPAYLMAFCSILQEPFDRWYPVSVEGEAKEAEMVQFLKDDALAKKK